MKHIISLFELEDVDCKILPFGNGLINSTWQVECGIKKYILQKINGQIFKQPEDIACNIRLIDDYLKKNFPTYLFASPCSTVTGNDLVKTENGYYRMFPFIVNSRTIDIVENPQQAYEAAKQFAGLTKLLLGLDADQLKITIPDFHNLSLHYLQFEKALETGSSEKIEQSKDLITAINQNKSIVDKYKINKTKFKIRITHHDTKISNVLFNETDKGLCVIDLDTVMPGYFISDVGDMMRTYLCPVSEEEKDFSKISVRSAFYAAIVSGYLSEMGAELNEVEKRYFHYAGEFMIYMQAIRFLTDYINNDTYYGAKYEGQNFIRAGNQITLLKCFQNSKCSNYFNDFI